MGLELPEPERVNIKPIVGVLLILFGAGTYFFNYERQSIELGNLQGSDKMILEYYAPKWDPFPHHVKISTEASTPVQVTAIISGGREKTETLLLQEGEKTIDVYPGETVQIKVENTSAVTGKVKTVLWCDSWNYAAALLLGAGIFFLIL
ncbi:MAG: hypothetical protein ACE5HH_00470 [Candidatus Hydrothermarchaeales archaeon]